MKASIALNSTKRMQSLSAPRPVALFFFVFGSYLVTSTAAKYLHELGHATVAYFLGVPLSSMTIVVNPFGSGYFRPTKFGFPTSNLENVLFAIAGAVVPILVLSLVSFLTINHGKMTKWLVGMLFGYSLLSNAVNLVSGAFTRASDGGYLVSLGLPVGWLLALCLLLGALGAFVLIKANFSVIVLSVERGLQKIVVFCGFLVSPLMGLALVDVLGDSFRRRLFFSSCEVLLLGGLFLVAILMTRRKATKAHEALGHIPAITWLLLFAGAILSGISVGIYATSGVR